MDIHILTIFPEMFVSPLRASILQRAQERRQLQVTVHDIREFAAGRHRVTDDSPYGGGSGMVMKPEPIAAGILALRERFGPGYVMLMSPQGRVLDQEFAKSLLEHPRLVLICGRYSGVDARVMQFIDAEVSMGDYVLTGGELPAMVLLDVVGRMIPGVVGDRQSVEGDSFFNGLLQGPQYTRPESFAGVRVPEVLLSGDHGAIAEWRRRQALRTTLEKRPELLERIPLTPQDRAVLRELAGEETHVHGA
ncbi:MAG: tRNA (guanosine(37)-N1)-methyltransferase TrmD [Candidatus Tectomicrobia bacterium]|nr:tRNA (guanosine(37)-N1)-methyltransferase TrmD [Candidatus Tectomicrobia bacterium]